MVAVQQYKLSQSIDDPIVSLAIVYDAKEKVSSVQHEQDLEASYKSGYDDASSQFNQQILDFRAEINALREGTFSQLDSKFQQLVKEALEALTTLTYDCVKRTLGGFEMNGEAIMAIVDSVIVESGLDEETIEVKLHPIDIELLVGIDGELRRQHPGLSFRADETLNRGDCILSSRFGKIDGLMSTKLDKMKKSLGGSI